jgi:hypothetical protein
MPSDYGNCKRRIPITSVIAVTASNISDEFVLHIPDEYDYRFKSVRCPLQPRARWRACG